MRKVRKSRCPRVLRANPSFGSSGEVQTLPTRRKTNPRTAGAPAPREFLQRVPGQGGCGWGPALRAPEATPV